MPGGTMRFIILGLLGFFLSISDADALLLKKTLGVGEVEIKLAPGTQATLSGNGTEASVIVLGLKVKLVVAAKVPCEELAERLRSSHQDDNVNSGILPYTECFIYSKNDDGSGNDTSTYLYYAIPDCDCRLLAILHYNSNKSGQLIRDKRDEILKTFYQGDPSEEEAGEDVAETDELDDADDFRTCAEKVRDGYKLKDGEIDYCGLEAETSKPPGEPRQAPNTLTFTVKNSTGTTVEYGFWIAGTHRGWPGGNQVYYFHDGEEKRHYFSCKLRERICFGAWQRNNPQSYWGAGFRAEKSCNGACCYACESPPVSWELTGSAPPAVSQNRSGGGGGGGDLGNILGDVITGFGAGVAIGRSLDSGGGGGYSPAPAPRAPAQRPSSISR